MTPAIKTEKQEDRLPLERALRALEDAHKSLKAFSTKDSVANNNALRAEVKTARHKAKKLRERCQALMTLWAVKA